MLSKLEAKQNNKELSQECSNDNSPKIDKVES